MDDMAIGIAITLVGILATALTAGVSKFLEHRWGLKGIRKTMDDNKTCLEGKINDLRKDCMKEIGEVKRDTRGIVRCLCSDPEKATLFDAYLREEWMEDINGDGHTFRR